MGSRVFATLLCAAVAVGPPVAVGQVSGPVFAGPVYSLLANADVVIRGEIVNIEAVRAGEDSLIYTFSGVAITEWLMTPAEVERLALKQLGGQVGNTIMVFSNQTDHRPGDDVLLALGARVDGDLYPIGIHGLGYVDSSGIADGLPETVRYSDGTGVTITEVGYEEIRSFMQQRPAPPLPGPTVVWEPLDAPLSIFDSVEPAPHACSLSRRRRARGGTRRRGSRIRRER